MNGMEYTPAILRAKGVALPVAQVTKSAERIGPAPTDPLDEDEREVVVRYATATDDEGNVLEEEHPLWLKFTMNVIADLEDRYGSQAAFQRDFQMRPVHAVRTVIALACGITEDEAGCRLLGANIDFYRSAIGAAWGLAHGMDPSPLARALRAATRAGQDKVDAVTGMLDVDGLLGPEPGTETTSEGSSPGSPGSEPGDEPAETSPSSGA